MPDECPEVSGCSCEVNPFAYVVSGAPDDDVIEEITAQLSGLRWELPCLDEEAICECDLETSDSAVLVGDPTRTYNIELRLRGFIEFKDYIGGSNDGAFFQVGGTPNPANPKNIYSLEISNPAQIYYLNRANGAFVNNAAAIDYSKVIQINGGSTVTLRSNSVEGLELGNPGGVVVPGVPPDPAAYDGQFLQMNVVSIS